MNSEQIETAINEAERILVAAKESFNWHPSQPVPQGVTLLAHAQRHLNEQRPSVKAAIREEMDDWNATYRAFCD